MFLCSQRKGEWRHQRIPPSYPVVDLGQESWRTCLSNANCAKVPNYDGGIRPSLHQLPPPTPKREQVLNCNDDKEACQWQARTHPRPGRPAGRCPPRPRAGAEERRLRPRRTWAARRAAPSSSSPCGPDARRARRRGVRGLDRFWREKKSVFREEHTAPAGHSLPLRFPPPTPPQGSFDSKPGKKTVTQQVDNGGGGRSEGGPAAVGGGKVLGPEERGKGPRRSSASPRGTATYLGIPPSSLGAFLLLLLFRPGRSARLGRQPHLGPAAWRRWQPPLRGPPRLPPAQPRHCRAAAAPAAAPPAPSSPPPLPSPRNPASSPRGPVPLGLAVPLPPLLQP